MLTTKLTRAIGGNTDLTTSQSFVFQGATQDSEQVILILVLTASGEDVFTKLRNLGFQTENTFYSLETSITERLKQTLDTLKQETENLAQVSILLAALKDEALYMLSQGSAQVLLYRNHKTTQLIEAGDTQVVSGSLQDHDRVLFLSPRFPPSIPETSPEPQPSEHELIETSPHTSWDDYFIQRLLLSDQEVIEQEIENYLQSQGNPEPIAVILLSTQQVEPNQIAELAPLTSSAVPEVNVYQEQTPADDDNNAVQDDQTYYERRFSSDQENPKKTARGFKFPTFSPKLRRGLYQLVFPLTFRKIGIIGSVLLIAAIIASVSFYNLQQKNIQKKRLTEALNGVRTSLSMAASQKDTDLAGAKQSIAAAQTNLQTAQQINKDEPSLKDLASQIAEAQKTILKTTEINNWTTFLSLDLIKPGFTAKKVSYSVGKFLLLDSAQKSLVVVDIKTKNNDLLAGSTQLGNAQYASLNGSFAFVYSTDKGLLRIDTNNKNLTTVSTPDKEWGRIIDLFGFSSNLYVLDAASNQIWKYVPTENGYSDKQIYLKDNQGFDFQNAIQLFIDYSVWVIKSDANIYRFTAGAKDFYSIGGLETPLSSVQSFFAPEEADEAFILEPQNKRVVLTKKNGEYISQYTSELFGNATDLVYDEETKTLYVLAGDKIHQTTLQ